MNIPTKFSDITIRLNGKDYKLHKIILDRLHFFSEIFSGKYSEKGEDITFLDISDSELENKAFEKMIEILYPGHDELIVYPNTMSELDVATFLGFDLDNPEYMYLAHLRSGDDIDLEFMEHSLDYVLKTNDMPKIQIKGEDLGKYNLQDYPLTRLLYYTLTYRDIGSMYQPSEDIYDSIIKENKTLKHILDIYRSKHPNKTDDEINNEWILNVFLDKFKTKKLNKETRTINNFVERAKEIYNTKY